MKKIRPLLISAVLFTVTLISAGFFMDWTIEKQQNAMLCYNADARNFCVEAMASVFAKDGTIPVFGSSEFSTSDNIAYPPSLFQRGNSDFNMILNGRGHMQSLHHTINVGALADVIPGKKVVLILSPQWFTENGLSPSAYASRFSEEMYIRFLKNPTLSHELRSAVSQRLHSVLVEDPQQLVRVDGHDKRYLQRSLNPVEWVGEIIYDSFLDKKAEFTLFRTVRNRNTAFDGDPVQAAKIDFEALREEAFQAGADACTNNSFGIYDSYFDQYIRDNLENSRNSYQEGNGYSVSPEYDDLILFIQTCQEVGIEPLIVSIPVNGRWYDWQGFPQEERDTYYQNIRDICEKYAVQLADFSDREYELYFLKDAMHLGWKGWVDLDEAVYKFYQAE